MLCHSDSGPENSVPCVSTTLASGLDTVYSTFVHAGEKSNQRKSSILTRYDKCRHLPHIVSDSSAEVEERKDDLELLITELDFLFHYTQCPEHSHGWKVYSPCVPCPMQEGRKTVVPTNQQQHSKACATLSPRRQLVCRCRVDCEEGNLQPLAVTPCQGWQKNYYPHSSQLIATRAIGIKALINQHRRGLIYVRQVYSQNVHRLAIGCSNSYTCL